MNYKEEVLKDYPDAVAEQTPRGFYYISSKKGNLTNLCLIEAVAWEDAYRRIAESMKTTKITVTGCGDCPMRRFAISAVFCSITEEFKPDDEELLNQCPLKQNSITIKLKENDTNTD